MSETDSEMGRKDNNEYLCVCVLSRHVESESVWGGDRQINQMC